jgi:putative membrane-bound dehydrogenase-like protein
MAKTMLRHCAVMLLACLSLQAQPRVAEMTLPPGFHADLIAAEPEIVQPVTFTFDDRGRLWVAQNVSYPLRAPEGQGHDSILVFEDTQGTGHFDKRTVFANNLNLVTGLQIGFGGVWVGAAPYLLFIPIQDGDTPEPSGPPQIMLDGWGYQDTHNTLSTFFWGPDGWLYGGHGVASHSKVGAPGTPDSERISFDGSVWRYHPTRHTFEVFAEGLTNPWGIDYNDRGQIFATGCVITHLWHVIQGARLQRPFGQHAFPYTYDDVKTVADHNHWSGAISHAGREGYRDSKGNLRAYNDDMAVGGGHAHAGGMIYLGDNWPAQYRDQIFMFNLHGHRVNEDLLERSGSGYVGHHGPDFLFANDPQSLWLNLQYGPDGSVFAIDFYEKNICHTVKPELYDRSNGRIFRISYGAPTRKRIHLQSATDEDLINYQLHANDWYVRHARRILQERGPNPKVHRGLRRILLENPDETRRLRALWALHATRGLTEELGAELLDDKSEYIRAWTIQLLAEDRKPPPELLTKFNAMAQHDSSPIVRLYLASVLQRLVPAERWDIYLGLLRHAEDATDHNLPLMLWFGGEPLAFSDPARALQLARGTKLPGILNFTTRRIATLGTPEATALVATTLSASAAPEQQIEILSGLSAAIAGQRNLAAPNGWKEIEARLATSADPQVRGLSQNISLAFGSQTALVRARKSLADHTADLQTRRAALDSLLAIRDSELPPVLRDLLADAQLRGPALRALSSYNDPESPNAILAIYNSLTPSEKHDALLTLAARPNSALALLSAVNENRVPAKDLSADVVRQLRTLNQSALNAQTEKLWGVARASSADKVAAEQHLKRLIQNPNLPAPDTAHGQELFTRTCSQCHTLFGSGGKIGPDLTGSNRTDLDYLLHNILDPNAEIPNAYRTTVLDLNDGRTITGIVLQEDAKTVSVITANESLTISRTDLESMKQSELSMMPEGLLAGLSDDDIRDLVAYIRGPAR